MDLGLRTSLLRILFASNNPGKVREVRTILNLPNLEIVTPSELGLSFDVVESGTTFEENARLKAQAALEQFGMVALADDSGLEIDALGGRPGVQSARFMGEKSSFQQKYLEILRLMADMPEGRRTARFRCCAALAFTAVAVSDRALSMHGRDARATTSRLESAFNLQSSIFNLQSSIFSGVCEGTIAFESRGSGGFGYDPIFVPDGFAQTFAELPPEVKNQISHRARAFFRVRQYLSARNKTTSERK